MSTNQHNLKLYYWDIVKRIVSFIFWRKMWPVQLFGLAILFAGVLIAKDTISKYSNSEPVFAEVIGFTTSTNSFSSTTYFHTQFSFYWQTSTRVAAADFSTNYKLHTLGEKRKVYYNQDYPGLVTADRGTILFMSSLPFLIGLVLVLGPSFIVWCVRLAARSKSTK